MFAAFYQLTLIPSIFQVLNGWSWRELLLVHIAFFCVCNLLIYEAYLEYWVPVNLYSVRSMCTSSSKKVYNQVKCVVIEVRQGW